MRSTSSVNASLRGQRLAGDQVLERFAQRVHRRPVAVDLAHDAALRVHQRDLQHVVEAGRRRRVEEAELARQALHVGDRAR
jgi:hypothetical protein